MINKSAKILLVLSVLVSSSLFAATTGVKLEAADIRVTNIESLQRGAKLFVNNCLSCHSVKYLRYSRMAEDLGLTEEQVMGSLNFTDAKFGETMTVTMDAADATAWFGAAPPDLSLTARAKAGGADWVYTYLKSFYVDESRPIGWNNTVLPNASMPNVLWEMQGIQRAIVETDEHGIVHVVGFETIKPGKQTPQEFNQSIRDISAFMVYAAEPAALQRADYGVWVVLFLSLLTFLAFWLKIEYWRDVH